MFTAVADSRSNYYRISVWGNPWSKWTDRYITSVHWTIGHRSDHQPGGSRTFSCSGVSICCKELVHCARVSIHVIMPLPQKQIREKLFFGEYHVKKLWHVANFSGKCHVTFGHLCKFFLHIFSGNNISPKADWAPTPLPVTYELFAVAVPAHIRSNSFYHELFLC